MKQRMREMDFIRAFAALSILAIHTTGTYVNDIRLAWYINQFVRFAVPLFILMSGLLLNVSGYKPAGFIGYLKFMRRRLEKIIVPYAIWTLVYMLFSSRHELGSIPGEPAAFLRSAGRNLIYGTAYSHLYFLVIILQLYLLFPLLWHLMKRWSGAVLTASFIITLFFQTGVYLHLLKIIRFPVFLLPNYEFFPTWIFFFVFGMYFAARLESWKKWMDKKTLPLAAVWFASFVILIVDSRISMTYSSSIKPTIMLYCITAFLLIYVLFLRFSESTAGILKLAGWFSAQSFLVYLSHLLVMGLLNIASQRLGMTGLWNGIAGMTGYYFAVLLLTCTFVWIVSHIPVAPLLGGVYIRMDPGRGGKMGGKDINTVGSV